MKQTFEDFLMEKHAEDYVGAKDCMVDDFLGWQMDLEIDDWLEYGDKFAKEQSKDLLEACKVLASCLLPITDNDKPDDERVNCYIKLGNIRKAAKAIAKAKGGQK